MLFREIIAVYNENDMEHINTPCEQNAGKWYIYRVVSNELDAFTDPRFTATGEPPAAERTRILPMTQQADNICNEGKFLPLFTDHRRC
jgi:hypothetical protein